MRSVASRRRAAKMREPGTSRDRVLAVLGLFTVERPDWTVEDAAVGLGVSTTTAYRYFKSLAQFGLISPMSRASYRLGPAIVELDRQIQISDPMLAAARSVMIDLVQSAADGAIVLLCRSFKDRVLCVHQVLGRGPQAPVSYERGRPMPLFVGATSKIILAHLPRRTLKRLLAEQPGEIAAAGLGKTWDEFKRSLAALRRAGACVAHSEVDPGRVGIAAPVFDKDGQILGSLSVVLPDRRADETLLGRLVPLTIAGAGAIERGMATAEAAKSRAIPAKKQA